MRPTLFVFALALAPPAPAAAQESPAADPRIVIGERAREIVRAHEIVRSLPAKTGTAAAAHAYQGRNRGPEQTERFSRKAKLGRDGRLSISNIAGDITVTAGS